MKQMNETHTLLFNCIEYNNTNYVFLILIIYVLYLYVYV